jgi:1-acyl-sn-glycerol-3-phosphate acyltransferase
VETTPNPDETTAIGAGPKGTPAYRAIKTLLSPIVAHAFRLEIDGKDRLPVSGPYIVSANHRSFMDSIFLGYAVPAPVAFVAKAEYFADRRFAWIFRATGQIPLQRGHGRAARQALDAAIAVLRNGGVVGIYPEGSRSRDGHLHRGTTGPARLASASGAPIVPIGLVGTDLVQAPGHRMPRPFRRVTMRIGDPVTVIPAERPEDQRKVLRAATNELMARIAELCGQPYLDRYAPGSGRMGAA